MKLLNARRFNRYLGFLFTVLSTSLFSQIIKGKIVDSKTHDPLPFANVFINNTTIGTVTESSGEFYLTGLPESETHELVISFVGYKTHTTKIQTVEGNLDLGIIQMAADDFQLATMEVSSSRDKEWERNLKKFKKIFLGDDKLAAGCTILNPWVINFPKDTTGKKFLAKAHEPIEIENSSLGYRIVFYLNNFQYDSKGYLIVGKAQFTELKNKNVNELTVWENNRMRSYRQSTHYLFKAMIDQCIKKEGFRLYRDGNYIDNVITRSSIFNADLGKSVFEYDTNSLVTPGKQRDTYRIAIKGRIEVHDIREKSNVRIYQDVFGPVSWISLKGNSITVNSNGFPIRPDDVIVSGELSNSRISNMLPLDYKPDRTYVEQHHSLLESMLEQIYVHTDKPYYYPGEQIWFKGYINYKVPAWRDSLSSTVYVELVDQEAKRIVAAKTLFIREGTFDNDFKIPDTLSAKTYYLRAYTNFNRNFGDENLFMQPIPVLNSLELVAPVVNHKPSLNDLLFIETGKDSYRPYEKISVTIRLDDEQVKEGNFSMSVVDMKQVSPVALSGTILDRYPISDLPLKIKGTQLPFHVENGISFSGKFLNDKMEPQSATLSVLQINPRQFLLSHAKEDGTFSVSGLPFYDTAVFSIQGFNEKNELFGQARIVPRESAAFLFSTKEVKLEIIKATYPQRIPAEYKLTDDTRMLEEVVIKERRLDEQYRKDYRIKRPYGKPDFILEGKNINGSHGNLLMALQGKIPGLIVRQANFDKKDMRWVVYLQRQISINYPSEVIITINDVIAQGTPEQILSAIDPRQVKIIEVKNGINVTYGSIGGNGILAIYLKEGGDEYVTQTQKPIPTVKVPGYAATHPFRSPDYSDASVSADKVDYRSTLYWNPNISTDAVTGSATISFYASGQTGSYRIIVEGVSERNEPIRSEHIIQIRND